jgi:hypothetical protein
MKYGFAYRSLFLAAALIATHPGLSQAGVCPLSRYAELKVTTGEHGRGLVPVTIDGQPVLASLRLEDEVTDARSGLADTLGRRVYGGRAGETEDEATVFGWVSLGGLNVPHVKSMITHARIDGDVGIGRDVLDLSDLEFDLGHGMVRLFKRSHCLGDTVYWSDSHLELRYLDSYFGPRFAAIVNGKLVTAALAPSAAMTVVDPDRFEALGLTAQAGKVTLGSLEFGGVRLTQLTAGPFYVRPLDGDPGARLYPEALRDKPDMLIGADVLKRLRLFVAQGEKVIYLTPSGG